MVVVVNQFLLIICVNLCQLLTLLFMKTTEEVKNGNKHVFT